MRLPFSIVPAFFVFCLCMGFYLNERAWNGQVYVYVGEERAPSAVRTLNDYSSIERKTLYRSAHTQLLANAEVFRESGRIGIQLGHPLLSRKSGGKEFGCQVQDHSGVFDHIEIVFIGTGISEGDHPARMIVDSRCHSLKNLNLLETVWIPMQDIVNSEPKDQEMQVFGDDPIMVRLEEIPSQWPESWTLWTIRLYSENNPDESLALDTPLLKQARPKLLSFDWKAE